MGTVKTTKHVPNVEYKLYKRRWLIMAIFLLYTINGGAQWVEYSIITDVIVKYYNVSPISVEWTTNVYMVAYLIFGFPSIYILNKLGVRKAIIVAACGYFVGAWIKVFSVNPDRFFILLIGQTNQAIWSVLTFGLAARFTAIWFGVHEISIAGALSLFGDQLGGAFAFLIPPLLVKNSPDLSVIETGLKKLNWLIAIVSSVNLTLLVLFFQAKPKIPPSAAQVVQIEVDKKRNESTFKTLVRLLSKPKFLIFVESYSLCMGAYAPVATLMNQIILINFPNENEAAGIIGSCNIVSGMISSVIISFILDKYRLFKENAIVLTTCSCIAIILFTISLKGNNILYVYLSSILLGFFMNGYYSTGVQMCIETSYPISEAISSSVMCYITQVHCLVMSVFCSYILKKYGDLVTFIFISIALLLSALLSILLPTKLKRQAVEKSVKDEHMDPAEIGELLPD